MGTHASRVAVSAALVVLAGVFAARAQDAPAPAPDLSGTYEIGSARSGEATATMDFKATITNNGPSGVTGSLVLRDPLVPGKVYGRFGKQTIPAGKSVMVMSNVTVPRAEYDRWSNEGPSLFLYTDNGRGEAAMVRIPLSRIAIANPSP